MNKKIKIVLVTGLVVALGLSALLAFTRTQSPKTDALESDLIVGSSVPDATWMMIDKYTGFSTKQDPSKIENGANPNGQNTEINDGDRISIRDYGYTILGTATTSQDYINSLYTFRRRDGENIMMRGRGSYLEYYEEGNDSWTALRATSTSADYGFSDYNINTDLRSYVYFGNGYDNFARWTGAHSTLTLAATSTATFVFADTTDFLDSGSIIYCGDTISYASKTSTGFNVTSAHACAISTGIAQAVQEYPTAPKGNIYLLANNRLFISGIASTTQAVYFSKYGDATTWANGLVTSSTADSAGIFNLGEGGGAVTGMVLDEQSIYIFKKAIIYKVVLSDSLYTIQPLKNFDSKSQGIGALYKKSVFSGGNGIIYMTPDNQIMNLARLDGIDYPQVVPISDIIKPTTDYAVFSSSTGIFWKNKNYIAIKSDDSISFNESVLIYNQSAQAWESPLVGWNVGDFTIYDDGTGDALYFGDSTVANVYKVTDGALDNTLGVTANYRTKRFDMGAPEVQKEIENIYIEGYITDQTTLTISLLLDESGYTQVFKTDFIGTETTYIYNADTYNIFGLHPFGYKQFGSDTQVAKKKFRVYLNKNLRRVPFHNFQLEFASDGENQYWEVTSWGVKWRVTPQDENGKIYRAFQ